MLRFRNLFVTFLLGLAPAAGQIEPPKVPDNLRVPESESVVLKVLGMGYQIYTCKAATGDGAFEWVLERPQADLLNESGEKIGKHYEGPSWEATDGSKVTGQVQQRAAAPEAGAVPWLLLKAVSVSGSGTFGRVTYIQRVNTRGGAPPAERCDRARAGSNVSIDYQADYYFYAPRR